MFDDYDDSAEKVTALVEYFTMSSDLGVTLQAKVTQAAHVYYLRGLLYLVETFGRPLRCTGDDVPLRIE
jgi:hypothetical protein